MLSYKKYIILAALLTSLTACNLFKNPVQQSIFFNDQGQPQELLCELLAKTGIVHNSTQQDIIAQTQKPQPEGWLRNPGSERFNMVDYYASRKEELRPLCVTLGLVSDVLPKKKYYDYVLMHGANMLTMRARIAFLVRIWQDGVRFKKLVFLTGQRDLDPVIEAPALFTDRQQTVLPIRADWQIDSCLLPTTETAGIKVLYEQADVPVELRSVPVTIVDAPKTLNNDGQWVRPNTKGTVDTWLLSNPTPGVCLAISNQPFVGYQDATARALLPASFTLETVGVAAPAASESVSIWLDSLARWLYSDARSKNK